MEIGRELGLPQREIDSLRRGGLLHDIGKLGIPTSILDKPAALTEQEFALIKRHPSSGAEILRPIPTMEKVIPIVAQHHERYDGSGYPLGLKGDEISLHARIVALADVVDAVSSNRPYRLGWPREKTLSFVRDCSGAGFDPDVVKAFLRIAAQKSGAPLTGTAWSPPPERPSHPLPLDAAPAGGPPPVREAPFSGYSEPCLRD
jgi:putative nucleotidyltransferase with HDIG domain